MRWSVLVALCVASCGSGPPGEANVRFEILSQAVREDAGTVTVRFVIDQPASGQTRASYTVSGSASNPADHDLADGVLVIPAGADFAEITLRVVADAVAEPVEWVVISLDDGSPAHTVAIVDAPSGPRHTILLVGDGMGYEQIRAAGHFANGAEGTLFLESLPFRGEVTTHSADSAVTDSAAAATAMATGSKVANGVIGVRLPGGGGHLPNLVEIQQALGRSVGLVTTTEMSHATPAAFGAHAVSRDDRGVIAQHYFSRTRPNVLLGGWRADATTVGLATAAGYDVVTTAAELLAVDTETTAHLSGQFGPEGHLPYEFDGLGDAPHLSDMVRVALAVLDNDADGFFLMVEGGRIDHAGHSNDIERCVRETVEFDNAVRAVLDWAAGRGDTLVVVTADHETGGLSVQAGNGAGAAPDVTWTTGGHTGVPVPIFAWGLDADQAAAAADNTRLFDALMGAPLSSTLR